MKFSYFLRMLALILVLPFLPLPACAELPQITGFQGEEERVFPLSSAAGPVGLWTIRIYRRENGGSLKVTLLTGAGPGSFSPPEGEGKKNDRPLGFGSTYEVVSLAERRAVLEEIPSLGIVLAVPLDKEGTMTLESSSLSREEIISAAAELLPLISAGRQ